MHAVRENIWRMHAPCVITQSGKDAGKCPRVLAHILIYVGVSRSQCQPAIPLWREIRSAGGRLRQLGWGRGRDTYKRELARQRGKVCARGGGYKRRIYSDAYVHQVR